LFYLGPVREITVAPEADLDCLPFNGPVDRRVAKFMAFYNRRLAAIARKRRASGCWGRRNTGWRELGDGFVPDPRVLKVLWKGVRRWLGAEWHALFLKDVAREGAGEDVAGALVGSAIANRRSLRDGVAR
jgi:hypothetical protein